MAMMPKSSIITTNGVAEDHLPQKHKEQEHANGACTAAQRLS